MRHRFLAGVDGGGLVEVGVRDPHDNAFVNELEEILVVVDQLRQFVMLLRSDFGGRQLLSGGLGLGLAWSAGVGIASLILHVLLLAFNEDLAVLDDGVAQKFDNYDEDLQAALPEVDSFVKFSLGIDLLFELLVSLGEVTLGLLCVRLDDVGLPIFPLDRQLILRFDCLVIFIFHIDITDGFKERLHDFLIVEYWHQVDDCLVLLVLNHKSRAVDRKDTSLDVSRSSVTSLVNEQAVDELDGASLKGLWTKVDQFDHQLEIEGQIVDFALELLFRCEVLGRLQIENPDDLDDLVDDLCQVEVLQDLNISLRVPENDHNGLEGCVDAGEGANGRD